MYSMTQLADVLFRTDVKKVYFCTYATFLNIIICL